MAHNTRLTCFYEFFPSQRPFSGYLTITEFSFHTIWSRIIRYRPRQKAEIDNSLRDLHNSLHHTKAKFNHFFRNISKFSACYPLVDFPIQNFGLFLDTVSGYQQMFCRRYCFVIFFSLPPLSFNQKFSYFVFGKPWTPCVFLCFGPLGNKDLGCRAQRRWDICLERRLLGNIPLNQWYIARIFQIWSTPAGKAGRFDNLITDEDYLTI